MPAVMIMTWIVEVTAAIAAFRSYRIQMKIATAIRKTITEINAWVETSLPQVSDTAESLTAAGVRPKVLLSALRAAAICGTSRAELVIWMLDAVPWPRVCTASGAT